MKGWKPEEIQIFIAELRKEFRSMKMRMQTDM
jgi:hypothetical protein